MSEQDEQVVEATNSTDEQDIEINLDDLEESEAPAKTYTDEQFKQVLARAKKAEAELKATKQSKTEATQTITQTSSFSPEEIDAKVLEAQGTPDDEIDTLKKIARVEGISVLKARNHNLFKLYKAQKAAEEKAQKANLGASKGSSSVKKALGFSTKGLSQEQHRELWKERMGL